MIEALWNAISRLQLIDVIDILVVSALVYQALLLIRGTRGWQMTFGVVSIFVFYNLSKILNLQTVSLFLDTVFPYFVFGLIVIFQAEIRRGLVRLGRGQFLRRFFTVPESTRYDDIVLAATTLSNQRVGALIVIERRIGLKNYTESGIPVDANLTYNLLVTIFNPKGPLHDGAVIIQGNRILAAACFLPLTFDPYLSKELGTRHRAAIGIARESDCVAVVVSEETGRISLMVDQEINRNLDGPRLLKQLKRHLEEPPKKESSIERPGRKSVGADAPEEKRMLAQNSGQ